MVHRGSSGIGKDKVHRCTGTEPLSRLYGPKGGLEIYVNLKCTVVQALMLCTGFTVHRGNRGIGKVTLHPCTGTEALYMLYGP